MISAGFRWLYLLLGTDVKYKRLTSNSMYLEFVKITSVPNPVKKPW